jgi:hypothetical protein
MRVLSIFSYSFSLVAEFIWYGGLKVNGRCPMANLSTGGTYEIFYVIMLRGSPSPYEWSNLVKFKFTLPEGITHYRTENLKDKPRGQWLEILAGEFIVEPNQIGDFKFSLFYYSFPVTPRLLIKGVTIRSKSK